MGAEERQQTPRVWVSAGLLTDLLTPFAWWMLFCGDKYKAFWLTDTKRRVPQA